MRGVVTKSTIQFTDIFLISKQTKDPTVGGGDGSGGAAWGRGVDVREEDDRGPVEILLRVVLILPANRGPPGRGGGGGGAGLALLGGRLEVLVAVEHVHRGGVREAHTAGAPPRKLVVLRPRRRRNAAAAAADVHGDGALRSRARVWDFGVQILGKKATCTTGALRGFMGEICFGLFSAGSQYQTL